MQRLRHLFATVLTLCLIAGHNLAAGQEDSSGPTPPRLSLIEGDVSFWRPGSDDWDKATLNTPLAQGDTFYADENANLEVQIGNRAFVRAGELTQISLVKRELNGLRFRVTNGQASFDLRALPAEFMVEVETPNAAFTIDRSGYYRMNVDEDTTFFSTRRGGRATVVPAGGSAHSVAPAEEIVVEGTGKPTLESYAVPERDAWDRWNYERTDQLVDALSTRYVPPDVYGAEALDQHGDWRVEPNYGTVWVPSDLPANWAPYSNGRWIRDPYYGWSWIDNAPWGWAPFHYGRWVFLGGFWAWAPGPVAVRSVYSPALVGFFNNGGASLSVSIGTPALSWVALSWGEPVVPWWGRQGFVGRPSWGGWHGPRVINRTTVVNVNHYQNTRIANAVVGVSHARFGRGPVRSEVLSADAIRYLRPIRGELPVKQVDHASDKPAFGRGAADHRRDFVPPQRSGLMQQAPREIRPRQQESARGPDKAKQVETPNLRFARPSGSKPLPPTPFGAKEGPMRSAPNLPPRFEEHRRPMPSAERQASPRQGANTEERRRVIVAPASTPANASPHTPSSPPPAKPPAVAAPQSPPTVAPAIAPRREDKKEERKEERKERFSERGSRNAEPAVRDQGRVESRALPGTPANRMSPRRKNDQDGGEEHRGR